jgi:predicted HNH restriction endonuclease
MDEQYLNNTAPGGDGESTNFVNSDFDDAEYAEIFGADDDDEESTTEVDAGTENTSEAADNDAASIIDEDGNGSDSPVDDKIARLMAELGITDSTPVPDEATNAEIDDLLKEATADKKSSDDISLMDDEFGDDYEIAQRDAGFISPEGQIVVMDPNDSNDDCFKLTYIDIANIAVTQRIRKATSVEDLVKSIKSTGLLKPVFVAPTSADGVYVLLDGYRRLIACAKAGRRSIPCVINTKVSVPDIPVLEAMYNHQKSYSIKEMIDYIDYLEKEKGIMSASMIEYLLQMNSGDYTKLKDLLNDNDEDIISKMMEGQYTIDQAFKKLEQRRKKESVEEKDQRKAQKAYEDDPDSSMSAIADSGDSVDDCAQLTEDEIKGLAINASDINDIEEESLGELIKQGNEVSGFKPHKQDPKYRERLDPTLRKSVLARDKNTCQICNMISGMEFTEVLDVHHIIEVYLGGSDAIENLITACTVCHKLIHLHARGELNIRPESEMNEAEKNRFKKIVYLGNIIRKGMEAKNMKVEQLKQMDNADSIGRTKPGTGQLAG